MLDGLESAILVAAVSFLPVVIASRLSRGTIAIKPLLIATLVFVAYCFAVSRGFGLAPGRRWAPGCNGTGSGRPCPSR